MSEFCDVCLFTELGKDGVYTPVNVQAMHYPEEWIRLYADGIHADASSAVTGISCNLIKKGWSERTIKNDISADFEPNGGWMRDNLILALKEGYDNVRITFSQLTRDTNRFSVGQTHIHPMDEDSLFLSHKVHYEDGDTYFQKKLGLLTLREAISRNLIAHDADGECDEGSMEIWERNYQDQTYDHLLKAVDVETTFAEKEESLYIYEW